MVEDLKKIRANISIYELLKLLVIRDKMIQGVSLSKNSKTPSTQNSSASTKDNPTKYSVNASSIGKKSDSSTPPFMLMFEICNRKVHNCMIDLGASKNIMPYSVCKKLNAVPVPCDTSIVQLDRSNVKVIGKLNEVLIRLASNPQVHFIIDIIVAESLRHMAYSLAGIGLKN